MAISVNFKTSFGLVYDRKFQINQGVSLFGKTTTVSGIGINPGTHVRLNIFNESGTNILTKETISDVWGDYDFWFQTPGYDTRLNIQLIASYPISGQDKVIYPIGVGNVNPGSLPSPEGENSLLNYIPLLLLIAGGIYILKK